MAELRISVGNLGLTMLAALGFSCGGATDTGTVAIGGTGGSVTSGGGESTGGAPGAMPECTLTSQNAGYDSCAQGWTHRSQAQTCLSSAPRADYSCPAGVSNGCSVDADCTASPNGYCSTSLGAGGCYCQYGCLNDSDCGAGQICLCGDPVGKCVQAACRTDAECPGAYCATYDATAGCGGVSFACSTPQDACHSSADCASGYCILAADGHRACASPSCAIGRPFIVRGNDRLAPTQKRRDWAVHSHGVFEHVEQPEQRKRLANYYRQVALMEHASVAAFARLSLQLMALGAPPELIQASIHAQADEVEHARFAFGLTSELSADSVGPGGLTIEGALDDLSVEQIAFTAVIEGCVGEAVAAAEASELCARADNQELKSLLDRIARDELRHAQLAYRVVAWLLKEGGEAVQRAVAGAFRVAQDRPAAPRDALLADVPFGALDQELADEVRKQTWTKIIAPAAASLGIDVTRQARAA